MSPSENTSGINSLGGFAFQIRVFIFYMPHIISSTQIEFETIDDVAISSVDAATFFTKNADNFYSLLKTANDYYAIQVKRSDINRGVAEKIIYNWLILENSEKKKIGKYFLVTDGQEESNFNLFEATAKSLFNKILKSTKKENALESKLKKHYGSDFSRFERDYDSIKTKYSLNSIGNIDEEIFEKYGLLFHKEGVNPVTYSLRIKEFIQLITGCIIDSIYKKQPYICTHGEMMKKIEMVAVNVTDNQIELDYIAFRRANRIDLCNSEIKESREYKQLVACNLNESKIEEHLVYNQYYQSLRYSYLSNNQSIKVENIEATSYSNFTDAKEYLKQNDIDKPYNRLDETKKRDNYHALKNQVKFGSCIYLTMSTIDPSMLISWDDKI